MATLTRPAKSRRTKSKPAIHRTSSGTSLLFLEGGPTALSRSTSLDTIAERVPQRIRLVPRSAPRRLARIGIELPEGTVVRLLALNDQNVIMDTLVDGWLPAGIHELADLCLPNGAYKLRLETPIMWYITGIMIG